MESTDDNTLNDLMLDVSLAANLPLNLAGRDRIRTIAAVNALGCITEVLGTRELKKLEYAVAPLLSLLEGSDVDDPVVIKASYALLTLMQSRICMREFLAKGGIVIASKILDYLLGVDLSLDLKVPSHYTKVLENLSRIYKEISVHHPWDVIKVGGIRHCVTMLRRGEANMCATAVGALASMCVDETVCKLMFSNGATKPIIAVSDADVTNEVCMLAGLGCITQVHTIRRGPRHTSPRAPPVTSPQCPPPSPPSTALAHPGRGHQDRAARGRQGARKSLGAHGRRRPPPNP